MGMILAMLLAKHTHTHTHTYTHTHTHKKKNPTKQTNSNNNNKTGGKSNNDKTCTDKMHDIFIISSHIFLSRSWGIVDILCAVPSPWVWTLFLSCALQKKLGRGLMLIIHCVFDRRERREKAKVSPKANVAFVWSTKASLWRWNTDGPPSHGLAWTGSVNEKFVLRINVKIFWNHIP